MLWHLGTPEQTGVATLFMHSTEGDAYRQADERISRSDRMSANAVVVAEVYKGGKYESRVQRFADLLQKMNFPYAKLGVDERHELFLRAGFTHVQVIEEYDKGWICAIGKNPSPVAENEARGKS
jgi:hypothetical protein